MNSRKFGSRFIAPTMVTSTQLFDHRQTLRERDSTPVSSIVIPVVQRPANDVPRDLPHVASLLLQHLIAVDVTRRRLL
jgi:hypothetical protein